MRSKLKSPEELVAGRENLDAVISFRLSKSDAEALAALATRAGVGPTTLCRRIVEEYVHEHARRTRG